MDKITYTKNVFQQRGMKKWCMKKVRKNRENERRRVAGGENKLEGWAQGRKTDVRRSR